MAEPEPKPTGSAAEETSRSGPESQSPMDRLREKRQEEKENRDPSLWQELFAGRDEDGNKRPPFSERFTDYTKHTIRRQQAAQNDQEQNPIDSHHYFIIVGIVVILLLLLVVLTQCQAGSGSMTPDRLSLTGVVEQILDGLQSLVPNGMLFF